MASTERLEGDQRTRLANQYETFLRSMVSLRGDHVSADQMGQIVDRAVASASPEERRNPVPSPDAINRLQQFLIQATETGRPRNAFSAEAARAAQASGAHGGHHGGHGLDRYDGQRGSSARFREIGGSGDGRSGGGSGVGGSSVSAPANGMVTPAYARSFADTGVSGGTLKTFAEVGMDRGTFNQFRNEGFSKAQIVDSAKDSQVLHFKGKDDLSAAQHAPVDLRKAAVRVEQAKPEDKPKAQAQEAAAARKYETLPDGDPRKAAARRFLQRLEAHGHHVELGAGKVGAGAKQDDAGVARDHAGKTKQPDQAAQDGMIAKFGKQQTAALSTGADDLLGPSKPPSPTPSKPTPVKTAAAKPPAGPKPA